MGKQVTIRQYRPYRPFVHTFWGTVLWVVPLMIALTIAGFEMAKSIVAPRVLGDSTSSVSRLEPVRILSPDEAKQKMHDAPSQVWTRGVQPSDIPKLVPTDETTGDQGSQHRYHRRLTKPSDQPADGAATTPAPDTTTNTGASPAPSTDGTPSTGVGGDTGGTNGGDTTIPQD